MPVDQPWNVYREQLSSLYQGCALWEPDPVKNLYEHVSIGDVGYIIEGQFHRMFNVTLPWDHSSNNKLGEPEHYKPLPLDLGQYLNIRELSVAKGDYYPRNMSLQANENNIHAIVPSDDEGVTYKCQGPDPGALLYLPHDGHRKDVIRTKVFKDYIRDNVVSWFEWSEKIGLGVECMEDLILVTGCTLATSWAAAVFLDQNSEISLAVQTVLNGRESFKWRRIRGNVTYRNSRRDPDNSSPTLNKCVFIRGFRAKRRLFWTVPIRAEAESLPDDPDNSHEDDIQVTRVPDAPKYRDPLIGVLDYIVEKCPEGAIVIAHDDDLQLVENVLIPTADAVENFLRANTFPVQIENGAAILRAPLSQEHSHPVVIRSDAAIPHDHAPSPRSLTTPSLVNASHPAAKNFTSMISERLVKADVLLKEAGQRLEKHKHTIDSANYIMAQGLLEIASDFRVGLEDKRMLVRHQQTQVYFDKAQATYKRIEDLTSGLY